MFGKREASTVLNGNFAQLGDVFPRTAWLISRQKGHRQRHHHLASKKRTAETAAAVENDVTKDSSLIFSFPKTGHSTYYYTSE